VSLPVVPKTWDGWLNDINGFHVKPENAYAALDESQGGRLPRATSRRYGMICYEFKGGIGTASRSVKDRRATSTVGALVQANFGRRGELMVAGVPVAKRSPDEPAYAALRSNAQTAISARSSWSWPPTLRFDRTS
jgi:L-aminopeptidase/D-esterase-like protein